MPVSCRRLLTTMFSSVLLSGRDAVASGSEPFPIKMSDAKDVS
jgi:hypothetical protein